MPLVIHETGKIVDFKNPQKPANIMRSRGPKPAIDPNLWPQLQQWERAGMELADIRRELEVRGVTVSLTVISRTMSKVRQAAPLPQPEGPELEPGTDADELRTIRTMARTDLNAGDWKCRHSAGRLLMAVRAALRETAPELPRPQNVPAEAGTPLSQEQEAALVAQQLGKRVYA